MPQKALIQRLWNYLVWNPMSGVPSILSSRGVNLEDPNTPINDTTIGELFGVKGTASGQSVNQANSFNNSAVWRCADIISGLISSLPVKPYRKVKGGREEMDNHSVYPLLTMRPSPNYGKNQFFTRAILHYLFWGNHIARIRRVRGAPERFKSLELIHPSTFEKIDNGIYYFKIRGKEVKIKRENIIHVQHLGDGVWGKGVITHAREDIGLDFAAGNYGANFFEKGGHYHDYIGTDQVISPVKLKEMQEYYESQKKKGGTVVMTGGMKYHQLGVPPEDAQFLQTRSFQTLTVARWFGVPPDKLGDLTRATHSNIEHQAIAFMQDTIGPIIGKFENEYTYKMMDWEAGEYIEWNMDAYVRADSAAKSNLMRSQIQNGLRKPNELRKMDNLEPVSGGDSVYLQKNMQRLEDFKNGNNTKNNGNGLPTKIEAGYN